ncbi:MAG: hypothetical protein ACRD3J_00160, partial [Thermoanaerobaculia bacterium]
MRQLRIILVNLFAVLAAGSVNAQSISDGSGSATNTVTTLGSGTTGVSATAGSAYPDVIVKTGNNSSSVFHVFNSTSATDLLRVQANGNVGIGTTSAATRLHIVSTNIPILRVAYDGTWYTDFDHYSSNVHGPASVTAQAFFINDSEKMRILSNGHVGVGTQAPAAFLDVHGGDLTSSSQRLTADIWPIIDLYSNYASTRNWRIAGVYHHANMFEILSSSSTGGVPDTTSRFIIDGTTGNVGIGGATSPTAALEIGPPTSSPVQFLDRTTLGLGFALSMPGASEIDIAGLNIGAGMPAINTTGSELYLQYGAGNVNIGSGNHGNLNVGGNINVTGTVYANYQDVAEWVPAAQSLP